LNPKKRKEDCKILSQEIETKKEPRIKTRNQKENQNNKERTSKNPCYDDYLIETFEDESKEETKEEKTIGTPVSSYFMNWLNIFAIVFIFAYYLIKKYNE
jgi:hypothetical protein